MFVCPACGNTIRLEPGADIPYPCSHCRQLVLGSSYCDLTWIGGGTMGDVYRARRPDMGNRTVAIKLPRESTPQFHLRFEREIAASALLEHENIVRAFDRGTIDGRSYLVMEFVNGRSLSDIIRSEHPLSCARVARIVRGVAAGLAHAQRHGIVNRDIKPENILLSKDGIAKILDYGLAMVPAIDGTLDRVTRSGVLLGTPAFMAPEQFHDPHSVTILADIYALGCTAYCALASGPPFRGEGSKIFHQHAQAPRPSIRSSRPDIEPELDSLLQWMMAIQPADRPTPGQVVQELDRLIARQPQENWGDSGGAVSADDDELDDDEPFVGEVIEDDVDVAAGRSPRQFPTKAILETVDVFPPPVAGEEDDDIFVGSEIIETFDSRLEPPGIAAASQEESQIAVIEGLPVADHDDLPPVVGIEEMDDPVFNRSGSSQSAVKPARWQMPQVEVVEGTAPRSAVRMLPIDSIVADSNADVPPVAPSLTPSGRRTASQSADATLAEGASPSAAGSQQLKSRPAVRYSPRTKLVLFAAACAGLMAGLSLLAYALNPGPNPDQEWTAAQDDYQLHKWKPAEKQFTDFAEKYPQHPRAADVPFFLDMCLAGRQIYSQTGDLDKGYIAVESLFKKYRDTPQYQAYAADFYASLQRLIERYIDLADKSKRPATIDGANKTFELLSTVGQVMTDEWVPRKTAELGGKIDQAKGRLAEAVAKKELLALVSAMQDPATDVKKLDELNEQVKASLRQFPQLAMDRDAKAPLEQRFSGEAQRVRFVRLSDEDVLPTSPANDSQQQIQFVVWDEPAGPPVKGDVFLALARGVLYAFDANGNHLWSRRLGVDSSRIPLAIPASANSPAAFLAVSSQDNSLLALAQSTGHVLWRYSPQQQDLSAPLTISRWRPARNKPEMIRGLLPTAGGEIHVIELSRGKRIGRFETGFPMTVGGTYDPVSEMAYFPADSKRIFAIDPAVIDEPQSQRAAARSVLFSNHASGSLRSPPVVVGQYLILTESSDLENTAVRVFEIKAPSGFPDAEAPPLKEITLRGWSWFTPPALPDRITVVTDEGELGVFGLNLDNTAEALYPLIAPQRGKKPLETSDTFRALAIQSDEYLLWLMAGGTMRHMSLDLLNQRWRTLWPAENEPPEVTGIPLHEAALDPSAQRIYIATRSLRRDEIELTAVDAETGKKQWRRQLGVSLATDPLVIGDAAVLIDRCGRVLELRLSTDGLSLLSASDGDLPLEAARDSLLWLPDAIAAPNETASGTLLMSLDEEGSRLAVRRLASGADRSASWQQVSLPGVRLQGRPAIVADSLLAPCSDGRLHRVPLSSAAENRLNEQPFSWAQESTLLPDETATVVSLANDLVLLINGSQARWLEFVEAGNVPHWKQRGSEVLAAASYVGQPLVTRQSVFLADERNTVYRIPRENPEADPARWELSRLGRISTAPFTAGERDDLVFVVTEQRTIVCLSAQAASGDPPLWTAEMGGRICGRPVAWNKYLLVTEESGQVTGIHCDTGQSVGVIPLGEGAIPAAAAVAFGQGKILVPLADGTLMWCELRPTRAKVPPKENL